MRNSPRNKPSKPTVPLTEAERARVEAAMPMVDWIASRLHERLPASVDLRDLMQWGAVGLAESARLYQSDRGAQFRTFAATRVRGAMIDGLRSMDHVPRLERQRQKRVGKPVRDLLSLSHKHFDRGKDVCDVDAIEDERVKAMAAEPERRDFFERISRGMPQNWKLILKFIYLDGLSQTETARALGIHETRVSQMHSNLLDRLRERHKAGELPELTLAA